MLRGPVFGFSMGTDVAVVLRFGASDLSFSGDFCPLSNFFFPFELSYMMVLNDNGRRK